MNIYFPYMYYKSQRNLTPSRQQAVGTSAQTAIGVKYSWIQVLTCNQMSGVYEVH